MRNRKKKRTEQKQITSMQLQYKCGANGTQQSALIVIKSVYLELNIRVSWTE
jgi:hypothetical protein